MKQSMQRVAAVLLALLLAMGGVSVVAENVDEQTAAVSEPIPTLYTVQFLDWDDTLLCTKQVEEGSQLTKPSAPQREGYTFSHWASQGKQINFSTYTVGGDYKAITLKACYVENGQPEGTAEAAPEEAPASTSEGTPNETIVEAPTATQEETQPETIEEAPVDEQEDTSVSTTSEETPTAAQEESQPETIEEAPVDELEDTSVSTTSEETQPETIEEAPVDELEDTSVSTTSEETPTATQEETQPETIEEAPVDEQEDTSATTQEETPTATQEETQPETIEESPVDELEDTSVSTTSEETQPETIEEAPAPTSEGIAEAPAETAAAEAAENPAEAAPALEVSFYATWQGEALLFGDVATLHAVVSGESELPYTLQWQVSKDNVNWMDVPGATGAEVSVTVTEDNYMDYWRVLVITGE